MKNDRKCRKCKERIPNWTKIDGIRKCLRNRKYCLKCSPWGNHNTKKNIDSPPSIRKSVPYSQWPKEYKQTLMKSNYKRGTERREKLVKLAGGKCQICGYSKCIKALEFHHRDPKEKLFSLSVYDLCRQKWDLILEEFKKCDLLCSNCHVELHDDKKAIKKIVKGIKEDRDYQKLNELKLTKECEFCKNIFIIPKENRNQRFCSTGCSVLSQRKTERPSFKILSHQVQTMKWVDIAKEYGVSDNAIRKWAKNYGIVKK